MAYKFLTLDDALAPRPKLTWLIDGVIPERSFTAFYGYPGSLKSSIVLDAAMAVATGKPFLPAMPGSGNNFPGFSTTRAPVVWIDLDNGTDVTAERLAAFSRGYQAPPGVPFYWLSYPVPTIQATRRASVDALQAALLTLPHRPGWIILDTLLRAAGVRDENSSEMDIVMQNLHSLAENVGAALTVISHSRKENSGRAGNGLRGHSSIEGGLDSVFLVSREGNGDVIEVVNQKARRKPVDPFGARWTYTADSISQELQKARFYWEPVTKRLTKTQAAVLNTCQAIQDALTANGSMIQSSLYAEVGGSRKVFDEALSRLHRDGIIGINQGAKNAKKISLQIP